MVNTQISRTTCRSERRLRPWNLVAQLLWSTTVFVIAVGYGGNMGQQVLAFVAPEVVNPFMTRSSSSHSYSEIQFYTMGSMQKDSSSPNHRLLLLQRMSSASSQTDNTSVATSKSTSKSDAKTSSAKKNNRKRSRNKSRGRGNGTSKNKSETWRLYGITTHPDDDDWIMSLKNQKPSTTPSTEAPVPQALRLALEKKLKLDRSNEDDIDENDENDLEKNQTSSPDQLSITIVRRSLDARRKLEHPAFQYVVDVVLTPQQLRKARLSNKPGKSERILAVSHKEKNTVNHEKSKNQEEVLIPKKKVLVIGAGPAGLFCALQLAMSGKVEPVLLDRGQPVEKRGRDIGALMHRTKMNQESNFAFGEGGAGTWSDGKLTTRIGRNSDNVRWILEMLVKYGAPPSILWDGAPHLGTDNLVKLLRNMRHDLLDRLGATIHFGTRLTKIEMHQAHSDVVNGVEVERVLDDGTIKSESISADAIVLATGHSARDVYELLAESTSSCLEPKGFAVGFRIEHPQKLITKIQYGMEWGPTVITGKKQTDHANKDYFASLGPSETYEHLGELPVPSYRLATDKAKDGTDSTRLRGVYSFCMCPGGQIVPASTNAEEVCVNGMSFSKRDSQWANSALVVTIFPDDPVLENYKEHGVLAGVAFQRDMERKAAQMGGGTDLVVPVQRVTDFIEGKISETLPSSSYRLGVKSSPCHEIYPAPITEALRDGLKNYFDNQMPGYVHEDGLLHAVETRTSSPVRIVRDRDTCKARGLSNMFPAGEGAGFAGGIVSAAVDGRVVAEAVLDHFFGDDRHGRLLENSNSRKTSVGFNY